MLKECHGIEILKIIRKLNPFPNFKKKKSYSNEIFFYSRSIYLNKIFEFLSCLVNSLVAGEDSCLLLLTCVSGTLIIVLEILSCLCAVKI